MSKEKTSNIFGLKAEPESAKPKAQDKPAQDDGETRAPEAKAPQKAEGQQDAQGEGTKKPRKRRPRRRKKKPAAEQTAAPEAQAAANGQDAPEAQGQDDDTTAAPAETEAADKAPEASETPGTPDVPDVPDVPEDTGEDKPKPKKRPRRRKKKPAEAPQDEAAQDEAAQAEAEPKTEAGDGPEAEAQPEEQDTPPAATQEAPIEAASDETEAEQAETQETEPEDDEPAEAAEAQKPKAPRTRKLPPRAPQKPREPEPEPQPEFPEMSMEERPEFMVAAMERAGWDKLMPVQAKTMPYMKAGRDIMAQARTGSGKTGAFVMPMLARLDPNEASCQALVLCPTRELAKQVEEEAKMLFGDTGLRTIAVYGGVGFGQQVDAFREGAHLVVGTPGRVLDHLLRRTLVLDDVRMLVFDEADRMLSIGFYPDMKEIQRYLPKKLHATMFSATFPPRVKQLSEEFLHKPTFLSLSSDSVHVSEVAHAFYEAPAMGKERALIRIIEVENPTNAIIFCNTKANVHFVTAVLQQFGYDADELSADLSQNKREEVLGRVRAGTLRFLVATDVAARGIDIPALSHVIQYEPPEDNESYVHRAGRTGRAGAAGTALSLVDVIQKLALDRIAATYKIEFEHRTLPTDEDVQKVAGLRLTALLENKLRKRTPLEKERFGRFKPLARSMAEDEETITVMAMLLDEIYQQSLHAPPPGPQIARPSASDGGNGGNGGDGGNGRKRSGRRRRRPGK